MPCACSGDFEVHKTRSTQRTFQNLGETTIQWDSKENSRAHRDTQRKEGSLRLSDG